MAKDVLLMADVADLGVEGDVVTVAEGYARNYLFPQRLAAPVTEATRRRLEKMQREREAAATARRETAERTAQQLRGASVTIAVKAGEDQKLYGSVGTADIARELAEQGIEIDRHDLVLDEPLRELGVFDVPVKLHPGIEAAVKVWVVEE
ncbi:MAG: 50S ribosomal protein L9 [Lentisphaerae bacterium]|nr:50S ribosomal protein L9 [Lentisphaerota bacterium]